METPDGEPSRRPRVEDVADHLHEAVIATDAQGTITYWNPAAERLLGWSAAEVVGLPLASSQVDLGFGTWSRAVGRLWREGWWSERLKVRHRDGTWRWVHASVNVVHGSTGAVYAAVAVVTDLTEQREQQRELARLAFTDVVTGLPNRADLLHRLERSLGALSGRERLAFLFLDLDRFKLINESGGHARGDRVLRLAAERLAEVVPGTDLLARFGGDEFTVLCPGAGARHASELAGALLDQLAEPLDVDGDQVYLGVSIGIALGAPGDTPDDVVRNADAAMYQAKSRGGGRYVVFQPAMQERIAARLSLEGDLRRAVLAGDIEVRHQPQVCLGTGAAVGVEALARWSTGARGEVSPAEFIHLAEEANLIVPLGLTVLRAACRDAAGWREGGGPVLDLTVNVSAAQLEDPHFVVDVREALHDSGLPSPSLTLEVTESTLLGELDHRIDTLHELRELGVRISIDDFGTGYSSLAYLKRLPIDVLKIDRSFIVGLGTDPGDGPLVGAILALSEAFGLRVVGEGVETAVQLNELRAQGCRLVQGWYFAPALPADALRALVVDGSELVRRLEAAGPPLLP